MTRARIARSTEMKVITLERRRPANTAIDDETGFECAHLVVHGDAGRVREEAELHVLRIVCVNVRVETAVNIVISGEQDAV